MGNRGALVTKALVAVLMGAFWVVLGAQPAAAHNSFTGSDPKDGARLAQTPDAVRLTFLARLDPASTKVTVTGPDDASATAGAPVYDGSQVTVPLRPGPAGPYLVRYEITSGDGHAVHGEVRFTVTVGVTPSGPASPTVTAAPDPSHSGGGTSPSTGDVSASVSAARSGTGTGDWWPWAAGGAAVLAALVAGAVLFTRRRRG